MTTAKNIISLSMLKLEKHIISIIDKKRGRKLYEKNTLKQQYEYVQKEYKELDYEMNLPIWDIDYCCIRNEISDCINTLEILYEMILTKEFCEREKT